MKDLRLAVQLIWGGGKRELVRLLLMSVGLTIGVMALLLVIQVPGILNTRNEILSDRAPLPAAPGQDSALLVRTNHSFWAGEPLYRVFVAATSPAATGVTPPGLSKLPSRGQTALSPAAVRLLRNKNFAQLVPGRTTARVGSAGLIGPDELVAYIGVAPEQLRHGTKTVSWGVPTGVPLVGTGQFKFVAVETAVLILPAVIIYVHTCGRLAAATRRRRYAALRLVGASRRTLARVATIEA
ncbi:MAG: hypothetical protein M3P51_11040, partial [Chloroflexota bacterium]|nr:hypothetical protein [Chloroflexota bacterium]